MVFAEVLKCDFHAADPRELALRARIETSDYGDVPARSKYPGRRHPLRSVLNAFKCFLNSSNGGCIVVAASVVSRARCLLESVGMFHFSSFHVGFRFDTFALWSLGLAGAP